MVRVAVIIPMLLASIVLSSCSRDTVYGDFLSVDRQGWSADSALHFPVVVPDSSAAYDVEIHVRHTTDYPYQNLWLFIDRAGRTDTLELYLADQRGHWFGRRMGSLYELTVPYLTGVHLPLQVQLDVRHGMRQLSLPTITDVGVTVRRQDDGQE